MAKVKPEPHPYFPPTGAEQVGLLKCCGAKELYGMNASKWTPENWFCWLGKRFRAQGGINLGFGYGIFILATDKPLSGEWGGSIRTSHNAQPRQRRIQSLVEYIRKYELGTTVILPPTTNPNNQRTLHGVIWMPDASATMAHLYAITRTTAEKKEDLSWTVRVA